MDKISRICNNERQYDEYHKLYERCNKSNVRFFSNNIMLIEIMNWKREKIFYNNREKIIDSEKKRGTIQKIEKNELNSKIQELTKGMKMMKFFMPVT